MESSTCFNTAITEDREREKAGFKIQIDVRICDSTVFPAGQLS